jgi:anion-transporting  ArsA/GET3 family ATPase
MAAAPAFSLADKKLILVVGKGGVGRSTVAAAIAGECARRGRRTLLFATNANDRFGAYFDKPAVATQIVQLADNLHAVNTTPAAALEEYGLMVLKFRSVYEIVFENRVTKAFVRAIPGLDDYAMLGKCWYHSAEEKRGKPVWDTIVFDMPASGHAVSMLRVPSVIIDTVPEGPLTRDAREVKQLLCDQARTAAVLVTLAEEMPVNEAIELEGKLAALGIVPQHVIANQIYPSHFASPPVARVVEAIAADPDIASPLRELAIHAELARDRRALNDRYLVELRRRTQTRVAELPMIFTPQLGQVQVRALGDTLAKVLT